MGSLYDLMPQLKLLFFQNFSYLIELPHIWDKTFFLSWVWFCSSVWDYPLVLQMEDTKEMTVQKISFLCQISGVR